MFFVILSPATFLFNASRSQKNSDWILSVIRSEFIIFVEKDV